MDAIRVDLDPSLTGIEAWRRGHHVVHPNQKLPAPETTCDRTNPLPADVEAQQR